MKRFFVIFALTFLPRNLKLAQRLRCQYDMHDYYDSNTFKEPWHFYTYTCERCGEKFII